MSESQPTVHDGLLQLIGSALDDLNSGRLDAPLPVLDGELTERERELIGHLRDVIASRRRAAQKLQHISAAIESALREVSERVGVATNANAGVITSAHASDTAAVALSESARRVSVQAEELHELIAFAADATSNLAETGRDATRDSEALSAVVGDIATAAAAIASSMKEIDRAIAGLALEATTTSNAVAAIDTSIRNIDAGAAEALALSGHMSDAAANGIDVVRQTADAVESINSALGGLGNSMDQLVSRSEEVTEITKIIQGIAVQAKLLALNASIQAAHAGEAGRGFAVVAREIKQLSDSTTDSTRDIEDIVRSILTEIAFAREETRASRERAAKGLELATAANIALDAIYAESELIRSRIEKISDATSTQTSETANVKGAIDRVTGLAEKLRATASERIRSSHRVVGRVREISELALRVRAAMADQESAGLGIVTIIERLMSVAGALELAVQQQSSATEELAGAIVSISDASRESQASVRAMAYAHGLLAQHVSALREEIEQVKLPRARRGGRIVVPLTMRGKSFDPIKGFSESHSTVLGCIFEPLVTSREGGRIAPAVAERWDVSGDGLLWTFHLRAGIKFHHGRDLVADDVRFSLERLAREADEGAFVLASVRGVAEFRAGTADTIAGIRTPDERTVVIELVEPIAFFLGLLALSFGGVQPRDVVERDVEAFARAPVGTGPFLVREVADDRLIVQRNPEYRDPGVPFLDEVEFDFSVTPEQALDGVLDGRYAFTKYVPRARLPELLADPNLRPRVLSITQPHCQYLLLNASAEHLPDARTRRAIAHAIDRAALVQLYSSAPVAAVAEGLIPPSCPGFDPSLRGPTFDPDLARRLVAASGYDTERALDIVLTRGPWSLGEQAIERVVAWLGDIGLRSNVRSVDDLNDVRRSADFDLLESAWYGDYLDPDTFTFGAFHTKFGAFNGYYECPELDRLFEQARATSDPRRRADLYRSAHYVFQEFCPALVVLHRRDYIVHSQGVDGVQLYPLLPTVRPRDIWIANPEPSE